MEQVDKGLMLAIEDVLFNLSDPIKRVEGRYRTHGGQDYKITAYKMGLHQIRIDLKEEGCL